MNRRPLLAVFLAAIARSSVSHAQEAPKPATEAPVATAGDKTPPGGPTIVTPASIEQSRAETKAAAAKDEVDEVRANKLISRGVTGGVAFSVQGTGLGAVQQRTAEVASMPYLMVVPQYWFQAEATAQYCATSWTLSNEDEAHGAARSVARKKAQRLVRGGLATARSFAPAKLDEKTVAEQCRAPDGTRDDKGGPMTKALNDVDGNLGAVCGNLLTIVGLERQSDTANAPLRQKNEDLIVDYITIHEWNPSQRGKCGWNKLGFWVGRPASYKAVVSMKETDSVGATRRERDVDPVVSFGAAFVPNPYLSLLGGFTLSRVKQASGADATAQTMVTLSVALGGNLDIAGLLVK